MMIGGSFFSVLPKGFFNWPTAHVQPGAVNVDVAPIIDPMIEKDEGERKRRRDRNASGRSTTPTLISPVCSVSMVDGSEEKDNDNCRPRKRPRRRCVLTSVLTFIGVSSAEEERKKPTSDLLRIVPEDVIAHCLSFLGTTKDRFALQTTCKSFRNISNSDSMLEKLNICGNKDTGKNGIIQETDTPATASATLEPLARAGNLEALYMLGIVKCYCDQDLKNGILMLKMASQRGYVRSSYALGIILRDSIPNEARRDMKLAALAGYLPAQLELLPTTEMKRRFGEPNADDLRQHLDPICLVSLLLRDYVGSAELRGMHTSHCWNPLCGKWAYKASGKKSAMRMRMPTHDVGELSDSPINHATASPGRQRSLVGLVDGNHDADVPDRGFALPPARKNANAHSCAAIQSLAWEQGNIKVERVSRMKMCSRCCKAKYCSKLCQVYDWRSSQHKMECQFL